MKRITLIIFSFVILVSCQQTAQTNNKNGNEMNDTKPNNPYYSRTDTTKLDLPDSEWKKILPHDMYEVARKKATERAYTGKYWKILKPGLTIVRLAAMLCLNLIHGLQAAAAGRAFLNR